jgi:hypothetical protein
VDVEIMRPERNKIEELIRRAKKTAKSKYRAANRLEQHHRLIQVTVALLSCALIATPLMQVFDAIPGYSDKILNMVEVILAVLVLIYSLLLGQERFSERANNMNRNAVELSNLARQIAGNLNRSVEEAEYHALVNQYYAILEKSENHKTIDYLFTRLNYEPSNKREWIFLIFGLFRIYFRYFIVFSHYLAVICVSVVVFYFLVSGALSYPDLLQ